MSFHHARRRPFVSEFEVRVDARRVYSLRYAHLGRLLFALLDPTYDGIDQNADFFLEFVAENAGTASWQGGVLERWVDADST